MTSASTSSSKSQAEKTAARTEWIVRACFFAVFVLNVQCAIQFIFCPADYVASYELSIVGSDPAYAAIQGLGVAFLMWNTTYPAFIVSPVRFQVLGWVILAQQLIGLVGEIFILSGVSESYMTLHSSIERFIIFDGAGFILMLVSFFVFWHFSNKRDACV